MTISSKPTPGPWNAKTDDLVPERGAVYVEGPLGWDEQSICDCSYSDDVETDEANARLIAEAGTVHHETGLTPQQLREALADVARTALDFIEPCTAAKEHGWRI